MTPAINRKNKAIPSNKKTWTSYLTTIEPKILVRIIVVFLVVDYFAFQKQLSFVMAYLLFIVPLVLFAITNYLWFLKKELPILHPYFGYTGFIIDKEHKANWALVAFIMTVGLIILISYIFPSLYEAVAQTKQQ